MQLWLNPIPDCGFENTRIQFEYGFSLFSPRLFDFFLYWLEKDPVNFYTDPQRYNADNK